MRLTSFFAVLVALPPILAPFPATAGPRIKDIVDIENVRPNQLVGYGLVVGLAGTGDRMRNSPFTEESLLAMLERLGVSVRGTQMQTQNVAAVSISATMPPFARAGSQIDVQVSSLGDASSLQGGTLLVSSLRAMDGEIYAVAQGPVALSGFKAQGAGGSVTRGTATAARIAGGAIVEREVNFAFSSATSLKLALKNPDFTTAQHVAAAINRRFEGTAEVLDPATIQLAPHGAFTGTMINLVSQIENLEVEVDQPARIVINEASGTVVMGADVQVSPVAIAQGGLTISISETPIASQPAPLSGGTTAVLPRTQIAVDDSSGKALGLLTNGTSLKSLVTGLNKLGVSPRDLITILQAVKSAGALQAENRGPVMPVAPIGSTMPTPTPKAVAAKETAEKFEAVFLGQMTQLMMESVETDGEFSGGHGEQMFRGVLAEKLGTEMAKKGGIGLAPSVMAQIIKMQGSSKSGE